MKDLDSPRELPGYNGHSAYDGALRFFGEEDARWISMWAAGNRSVLPSLDFFAADAFGVLYGVNHAGIVSIFWTETGQIEDIGVDLGEFYSLIYADPENTINISLYNEAVAKLGRPSLDQNFALKVETALGGKMAVDNIYLCDRSIHMRQLGELARQIADQPIGTKFVPVGGE